jgi:RNA polymerase sigma-70 factor (ECF subfamily)
MSSLGDAPTATSSRRDQRGAVSIDEPVAALYSTHHLWLQKWLLRRLGCLHDAADLTHDTFLQVIKANTADDIRSPRTYLASIAKALTVNLFRRRAIEQTYLDSLRTQPEPVSASPESFHTSIEKLIEIDASLSGLPSKVRHAFLMSRLEGLTYAEIAQRLGVTERTIKNYMATAMVRCLMVAQREQQ